MMASAIKCVRVVAAVFCVGLTAFFAAIPLLVPAGQQSPTVVIVAAAIMAAGLAYALWPWRGRNSVRLMRLERSTTPTLSEHHNESQDDDLKMLLPAGEPEAYEAANQEAQRNGKDAAQNAELEWGADEERKELRVADRSGGAANEGAADQYRQIARKAAQANGHKWRELTQEQRQAYLKRAREISEQQGNVVSAALPPRG
jgi:hypothetical protein